MYSNQKFQLWIGAPPESDSDVKQDLTKYIFGRSITLEDEDGQIKTLRFDMDNAYLMMDVLSIGMTVHFEGGTVDEPDAIKFKGDIKSITPKFQKSGDVSLEVVAFSSEGKALGVGVRDVVYPSRNHPKTWATGEVTYSDIIINLAKDSNYKVLSENIQIKRDATATFKRPVRQKAESDWEFTQRLAMKLGATLWAETDGDSNYIHLEQDSSLVNKVADHTFFFPAKKRDNTFIDFTHSSPKQIQFVDVDVTLDRDNNKSGIEVTTNPQTGQTEITNTTEDDEGNETEWILDEEKLRGLSSEERRNLISLFKSGKITWEGGNGKVAAKQYFKKKIDDKSSREPQPTNVEVVTLGEDADVAEDGVSSEGDKKLTGNEQYETKVHTERLRSLSSEERSAIMGRIFRGEATSKDQQYFTVVASSTKADKPDSNTQSQTNPPSGGTTDTKKKKRDAGFKITALIYGNVNVRTKMSYILEGLGKYSDKYYLYKIEYIWGNRGFLMNLVFVK